MRLDYHVLFDLLYPPSADERLVRALPEQSVLPLLSPTQYEQFVALTSFKDPTVRALIHLTKFHHHHRATTYLGLLLYTYLDTLPKKDYVLVPIPLSKTRTRTRGYNQVVRIITAAQKHGTTLPTATLLKRVRDTTPQTSLRRKDRRSNMVGAFRTAGQACNTDWTAKDIILVDDVGTTGATLAAAEKALKSLHPRSITSLVLAH